MTPRQKATKRVFDFAISFLGLLMCWWLILLAIVVASVDTKCFGLYRQTRVGKDARPFRVLKIRTMRNVRESTTITTSNDSRVTRAGRLLRRLKIDELPQLYNVLIGDMSFVGPRPDVPGYADKLTGNDRLMLSVRPGITGLATLYFRNEEQILANHRDPESYNNEVIFPAKVKLNLHYIKNYSFRLDLMLIWATVAGLAYRDCFDDDLPEIA